MNETTERLVNNTLGVAGRVQGDSSLCDPSREVHRWHNSTPLADGVPAVFLNAARKKGQRPGVWRERIAGVVRREAGAGSAGWDTRGLEQGSAFWKSGRICTAVSGMRKWLWKRKVCISVMWWV